MALFRVPGGSSTLLLAFLVSILLGLVQFAIAFRNNRRKFRGLPAPPAHPIWGHLLVMNEARQEAPSDVHPHIYPSLIKEKYGMGDAFYLNLWPFAPDFLIISDPVLAQQLLHAPKYWTLTWYLDWLSGPENLVGQHGPEWKMWRGIFNPGFAGNHLMTLVPQILEDSLVFYDILCENAQSKEVIRLEEAATRLTVDVIARVTLDMEFNAQRTDNEFLVAMKRQVNLLKYQASPNPLAKFNPIIYPKRWYYDRLMKQHLKKILHERFEERKKHEGQKRKHVIDLALEAYYKEQRKNVSVAEQTMDPTFERNVISQLRIFFFAGHDTSSSLICYFLYAISTHPDVEQKVIDEHNQVFGNNPDEAAELLRQSPQLINKLEYTLAAMKECLRLWPPASSLREENTPLVDPATGTSYPTSDFQLWILHVAMHRNPKLFPDPHAFRPARFLAPELQTQPENAWRPFERGPRNCIGQELALLEVKIVLVLVVRRLRVKAAYDELKSLENRRDGMEWSTYASEEEGMRTLWGDLAYQTLRGTAKPRQGLPVRVFAREGER